MSIAEVNEEDFIWEAHNGPAGEVRRIAQAATKHEGVSTLNEQAVLGLRHRGLDNARLWLGNNGFALLRDGVLDLAVHPDSRRMGVANALAARVAQATNHVEAWSHSDHPGAAALARTYGVPRERELIVMKRPTSSALQEVIVPDDIVIRTFAPEDEAALLDVNAAAFAHHPEQGALSAEDLHERMAADWWDPEGLFVAAPKNPETGPAMLGFHWTKVHRDTSEPYGEVYVVAVNPRMAGRGLGTVLTHAGLEYLSGLGLGSVLLYVDGDNAPAIAVYTKQGFGVERTEAQYVGALAPRS